MILFVLLMESVILGFASVMMDGKEKPAMLLIHISTLKVALKNVYIMVFAIMVNVFVILDMKGRIVPM